MATYGRAPRRAPEPVCEHEEDHTPCPDGYIQWHTWAEDMAKTHQQRKCASCGLYEIWEPR